MPYLTVEEYMRTTLGEERPDNLEYLIEMASAVLDAETRYFYAVQDLETDPVVFRARQFKRALLKQVEFFAKNGVSGVEELNDRPDSVSIGDTTVAYNRTATSANCSQRTTALSTDAKQLLASVGLLYRGGSNVQFA